MKKESILFLMIPVLLFLASGVCAQNNIELGSIPDSNNQIIYKENLTPFFTKLQQIKTNKAKVNILQLGDSHMQMGYFVDEMRNDFSSAFGASSVGTIFPYSIANYRPFYVQSKVLVGNWEGKNYLNAETDMKYGVSGFTIKTINKNASFEITPKKIGAEIETGNEVIIYYQGDENTTLEVLGINSFLDSTKKINATNILSSKYEDSLNAWKKASFYFESPINKISITINQTKEGSPFYIYGMQLNNTNKSGIIYNNCGVGGAQFSNLCKNASLSISQIKDINPDLIILSYGSNESYTTAFKYNNYFNMVREYLMKVKQAVPNAAILLTSPPDTRSKNRFPINSDSIGIAFKNVAQELNLSFWDLRTQMGGNGSLFKWLKNGLASKDQLHFTKEGYALQAKLLITAIFDTYNKTVDENEKLKLPLINQNFK
jgi:lysophospholipase L1-like esterase